MHRKRYYRVNVGYFDEWSHKMAYILGFITADGYVGHNTLSIDLHPKDIDLLNFVRDEISPNKQIEEGHRGKSCRLRIHSVELTESLNRHGLTKDKTFSLSGDISVPQEYLGDYVRGFFDGDGWVCCRRNSIECGMVSASEEFLYSLRSRCGDLGGIRKTIRGRRKPLYRWEMYASDTMKLRELMYGEKDDKRFCLHRKKKKFFSQFYVPSKRWWTEEQMTFLIENWHLPLSKLPSMVGKSYKAISKRKWELRRDKDPRIAAQEKEVTHDC